MGMKGGNYVVQDKALGYVSSQDQGLRLRARYQGHTHDAWWERTAWMDYSYEGARIVAIIESYHSPWCKRDTGDDCQCEEPGVWCDECACACEALGPWWSCPECGDTTALPKGKPLECIFCGWLGDTTQSEKDKYGRDVCPHCDAVLRYDLH